MERALKECVDYFKNNIGYKRIFQQMKEKWISYGKVSGNIIINNPTIDEQEAVKKLMGIVTDNKKIKFKMSEFEKALKETKFNKIDILEILEEYFQEKIIYQMEKKIDKEIVRMEFFENIRDKLKQEAIYNEKIEKLLNKIILEKASLYKYKGNNVELEEMIYFSLKAIKFLESQNKRIKIAMLGAEIAKSPHYFDKGTSSGNFFIYLLCSLLDREYIKEAEKTLELYYNFNIEVDSISSYTAAFGIRLYTEKGEHRAYREFIERSEDYLITISNLKNITEANSDNKKVFVIENQMVFSYLCEQFKEKNISILCTAGQPKTASLILIDMLCKAGCILYYSGDMDPEGIEIADKLIQRNKNIIPWNFTVEDYETSISENIISDKRLKKLDKIKSECFNELIKKIKMEKKAGYQELLLNKMLEEMKKLCKF